MIRRCLQFLLVVLLAASVKAGGEGQAAGPSTPPAGDVASQASPSNARQMGDKREVKGVSNFGQVTPHLLRGAQPTQEGFEELAKMGVNLVIDLRGDRAESEGKEVERLGMKYVAIPWRCSFPKDAIFAQFLKTLRENSNQKVFVHCRLGEDRTGMMIAAYRMADEGWTADEAMAEMQKFGFSTFHHMICPGLASYEKDFPEHLKENPAFVDVHARR